MKPLTVDEENRIAEFQRGLSASSTGESAIILRDHDGPDGRWVGAVVEIVGFNMSNPFPFKVKSVLNGAPMWCAASMLGPLR